MEANYKDREDMVQLRIKAKESYQVKRILEAIEKDKDFVLMSKSDVRKVKGAGPRLRAFASIKDLKQDKRQNRKPKNKN